MTSKTNKLLKRSVLRPTCIDPYPQKAYTLEIYLHTKSGDKRHHLGETRAEIKSKHHLGRQFDNDLGKQALFCSIISISTNMECRIESMLSCIKIYKNAAHKNCKMYRRYGTSQMYARVVTG